MKIQTIIKIVLIFIIIIAGSYIFYFVGQIAEAKQESNLLNTIEVNKTDVTIVEVENNEDTPEITERITRNR